MKILYADDDPEDRDIFCHALKTIDPNIECVLAFNGVEAIAQLNMEILPDYIFLDINMPVMTGKECLKVLKKNSQLSVIPVIIYSTSNSEVDIKECEALGAYDYMVKPSHFTTLCERLDLLFKDGIKGEQKIQRSAF